MQLQGDRAKTEEDSMAKEGGKSSVTRINGSKQERAEAPNSEKKGLQYGLIQLMYLKARVVF